MANPKIEFPEKKIWRELFMLFDRPVDLAPQEGLKSTIRDTVLSRAQEVYAA